MKYRIINIILYVILKNKTLCESKCFLLAPSPVFRANVYDDMSLYFF